MKNLLLLIIAVVLAIVLFSSCGRERFYFQTEESQVEVIVMGSEYQDFIEVGDTVIIETYAHSNMIRPSRSIYSLNRDTPESSVHWIGDSLVSTSTYKKAWRLK